MQNFSTSPKKTDLNSERKRLEDRQQLQPKAVTLQKILQFASSYRVERIKENQYVEWYLNWKKKTSKHLEVFFLLYLQD